MKWFYNLKISQKLGIGFITIALIAVFIGLMGYYSMSKMKTSEEEISGNRLPSLQSLLIISEAQTAVDSAENALLTSELVGKARQSQYQRINDAFKRVEAAWAIYEPLPQTAEEKKVWPEFVKAWDKWKSDDAECVRLLKLYDDKKSVSLRKQIIKQALEINAESFTAAEDLINKLVEINKEAARSATANFKSTYNSTLSVLIVSIIIGIILSIILSIFISGIVSNPIKKVVEVADEISNGNLDVNIVIESSDETGKLATAFNKMADNLNETMYKIRESSEQVATGAKQISISGQQLSQGSTEQASSIEEITSSMTQIATQTKQNAETASEANRLAETAKDNATTGNGQMAEMLKSMAEINDSSSKISKIIKVIDEIAFQTNILALNAAVEAARAGQHGKGFAVVAEEVRNLAARSANAAKETTEMIESSIKKVEIGTNMANDTAKALDTIVSGIARVAELVNKIAIASNEQSTGISQVNSAIEQVSEVVQTNSATAEESASASEELSSLAELLKNTVADFKVKKDVRMVDRELNKYNPDLISMLDKIAESNQKSNKKSTDLLAKEKTAINLDSNGSNYGKY